MQKDKVEEQLTYEAYQENYKRRITMRKQNFQQRDEDLFGGQRRTAQIKTIQKFIGKLKSQAKNYQAISAQLQTLNMSKYIEQISNIIATSINEKQIIFYAEIATKLSTSYENVPSLMIKDLVRVFNQYIDSQDDNKAKIKTIFLFTVELFVCGFSFSYKELIDMIKKVFKSGKNKKSNFGFELESKLFIYCYSCTIFSTFLTHFSQIFTKRQPQWIETWRNQGKEVLKYPQALPIKTKDELTAFFSKYVIECFGVLAEVVELIKKFQSELFQCLRLDGEFNKQTQKIYVEIVEKFYVTRKHLKQIALSISEKIDFSPLEVKMTTISEIMAKYVDKSQNAIIFQDEFQRQIYQNIQQLVTTEQKNTTDQQYRDFKHLLDNCKNVIDTNQIAKSFNAINNKKYRKSLAKDVLEYRKQYHLVTPYLCRVIAIVNLRFKDMGESVKDYIFSEYDKIKDSQATTFVANDKKSRIMKYICQFTKFKVIEAENTMNCIQNLIDNLNGFNIELIVTVLQNVGRFLHLSENSANRFTFLMKKYENIIKKKSLPILTTSQLINSINLLKPRKEMQRPKQKPNTAEQIRAEKIMEMCVNDDIDELMNQIDDIIKTEAGFQAIKIAFLKKIEGFDFMGSYNYAYLLEQLKHTKLSSFIVERTIQNLMLYLASGENQKTILWAKFFAQLYNYKLIQRNVLLSTTQNILKIANNEVGVINAFCCILEACSGYLDSKKTNRKNQKFLLLVKFKNYLTKCKYIPMLQEYEILDIFDQYEPDLTSIDKKVLDQFILYADNKSKNENRQIAYSEELDRFLSKKNLKRYEPKVETKDTRGTAQSPEKIPKQDLANVVQQLKSFDKEFTNIMQENRKDYSSRIAKPVHLQKVFDKKKQKKKDGPCVTVIGRSGNRFIKKDVAKTQQKKNS